jgi:hypothetical protein
MLNVKQPVIIICIDQHKLILHETFSIPTPLVSIGHIS